MHCHLFRQSVFIGVPLTSHRVHPKLDHPMLDHPMHLLKTYPFHNSIIHLFHNAIHLFRNAIIHLFCCMVPNYCRHLN